MRKNTLLALVAILAMVGVLAYSGSALADDGGRPFFTEMDGAQEAPGPGDPDGTGTASFTLNPGQGEVCFELAVEDIVLPASGAHIHAAPVGTPGPVVVPLTPPDSTGTSSGCRTGVDRDLIVDIIQNPENYYVNVHNSVYPGGAVRGQLGK
ncbi:MAG TPA: CHRD domain-containing protein [Chloroflexia bacterium]|nr:CHRD domain-containing protein [Chloroflexia bacterium]